MGGKVHNDFDDWCFLRYFDITHEDRSRWNVYTMVCLYWWDIVDQDSLGACMPMHGHSTIFHIDFFRSRMVCNAIIHASKGVYVAGSCHYESIFRCHLLVWFCVVWRWYLLVDACVGCSRPPPPTPACARMHAVAVQDVHRRSERRRFVCLKSIRIANLSFLVLLSLFLRNVRELLFIDQVSRPPPCMY